MRRSTIQNWSWLLLAAMVLTGCHASQPFYLGQQDEMSHYIGVATEIEYPDVAEPSLNEVTMASAPLTLANAEFTGFWDLTLEAAIQAALHNSKVIRTVGGANSRIDGGVVSGSSPNANVDPSALGQLTQNAANSGAINTVYDPALQESNIASPQTQGVESALSAFDAQAGASLFWDRTNRPQNNNGAFPNDIEDSDDLNFTAEISKRAATGSEFSFRNNTIYDSSNNNNRDLYSDWTTNFEVEARQPLLRGRGTQVNRVPVVVARIRGDISVTDFECSVRETVRDVEDKYWELYFAYRNLEALKQTRDSAHKLWKSAKAKLPEAGATPAQQQAASGSAQEEAQARQQYLEFRSRVESALADLYKTEKRLRFLIGLATTDGQLIRPVDEPITTQIQFDWHQVLSEALCRRCELRIKKWQIKQADLELIAARNNLLPQFDVVGLYRWLGRGDDLANRGDSPAWNADSSDAWESLFNGDYQEWRLGGEFRFGVGFRRELAGVRNAQLQLAREKALLEEMELEVSHQLASAIEDVDAYYMLAQTNFNRKIAADAEVRSLSAAYDEGISKGGGYVTLNLLLDAQRRQAEAQASYYRSITNHMLALADVHRYKGSLLEYDNVMLAEGPWTGKAYFDAHHQARKRAASHYMNYGYTRPGVVSRGTYAQQQGSVGTATSTGVSGEVIEFGPTDGTVVPYELQPGETIVTPPGEEPAIDDLPDAPINASAPRPLIPLATPNREVSQASATIDVTPATATTGTSTSNSTDEAAAPAVVEPKRLSWNALGTPPQPPAGPAVEVQFRQP